MNFINLLKMVSSEEAIDIVEGIYEDESISIEFYQLRLIDDIIGSFISFYPVHSLINDDDIKHQTIVNYKHKDITYNGTIQRIPHWSQTNKWFKLVIRLSHDGFRYPKIDVTNVVGIKKHHHDKPNWLILRKEYLEKQNLNIITKISKELSLERVRFLYNRQFKSIDISFYNGAEEEIIMFCFHKGYPSYADNKEEYYWNIE
jgi:hypothetical protein